MNCYQLNLALGRTDEFLDLISSGAVVRLLISAPIEGSIALPGGLYKGSGTREDAYTFSCGTLQEDKTVSGSYVGIRSGGGKQTQIYPIERGNVTVSLGDDGLYKVDVRVNTAAKSFRFAYIGELRTFDCTQPD